MEMGNSSHCKRCLVVSVLSTMKDIMQCLETVLSLWPVLPMGKLRHSTSLAGGAWWELSRTHGTWSDCTVVTLLLPLGPGPGLSVRQGDGA